MICRRCLYKTDDDPDYVNLPDYLLPPERISKKDIRKFQSRSYVLRDDVIYSQSEFQELESAYHELVPLSKKIKLMA
ncbi:11649_t:CDS:2, partial [Gigaspora rosea]